MTNDTSSKRSGHSGGISAMKKVAEHLGNLRGFVDRFAWLMRCSNFILTTWHRSTSTAYCRKKYPYHTPISKGYRLFYLCWRSGWYELFFYEAGFFGPFWSKDSITSQPDCLWTRHNIGGYTGSTRENRLINGFYMGKTPKLFLRQKSTCLLTADAKLLAQWYRTKALPRTYLQTSALVFILQVSGSQ